MSNDPRRKFWGFRNLLWLLILDVNCEDFEIRYEIFYGELS